MSNAADTRTIEDIITPGDAQNRAHCRCSSPEARVAHTARRVLAAQIVVREQNPAADPMERLSRILVLAGYVDADWPGFDMGQSQKMYHLRALPEAKVKALTDEYWANYVELE